MTAVAHRTTGYRTLSSRAVLGPYVAGGALAVAGGLGVWVLAVQVSAGATDPSQVARVTGASHFWGWAVATLGIAAAAAAPLWERRKGWLMYTPAVAAVATIVVIALQLRWASATSSSMAHAARANAGVAFSTYHAGFGWGAWMMGAAAVLLGVGALAGALRFADVRKGIES